MENLDLIMTLAIMKLRVRPTHMYYYPHVVENNPDFKGFNDKEICGIEIIYEEGKYPGGTVKDCPFFASWFGVAYPVVDIVAFQRYFTSAYHRIKNASPAEIRYLRLEYL